MKNEVNNWWQKLGKYFSPPPETDQFQANGKLSPDEFRRAGDKLTQVCTSWTWKPSSDNKYMSKYLDEKKQYLVLQKVLCRRRLSTLPSEQLEKIEGGQQGEQVVVLQSAEIKEEEEKQENYRHYTMYIIYDQYYHTPRMFFSAMDMQGKPVQNEKIRQDIQKQYLDQTLTMEPFPFIQGLIIPTVHPCKHANVLKIMSDAMREGGHKVQSHYALLIFLKFITNVIPCVEFDITGDIHFD